MLNDEIPPSEREYSAVPEVQPSPVPEELLVDHSDDTKPNKRKFGDKVFPLLGKRVESTVEAPPAVPPPLEQMVYQRSTEAYSGSDSESTEAALPAESIAEAEQQIDLTPVELDATPEEPKELERELSHEVKGENVNLPSAASSVGQVLADLHRQTAAAHAAFGQSASQPQSAVARFKTLPPLYKKAVFSGLASALLVLVLLLLLTVLS